MTQSSQFSSFRGGDHPTGTNSSGQSLKGVAAPVMATGTSTGTNSSGQRLKGVAGPVMATSKWCDTGTLRLGSP
ncbi:MAG: hypothetical protein MUC60_17740 [Oscillatoria sp. Prado101]|nr:hypothetical protein [Oscillatoria sp. Prado101]